MAKKKAFQYQIPKPRQYIRPERDFQRREAGAELTGYVDGQRASDIEEIWYEATILLVRQGRIQSYRFQPSYLAGQNMPGEVRVDFVWDIPPPQPIFLDGEFAHKSAEQRQRDRDQMDRLNEALRGYALPAVRIPGNLLKAGNEVDLDRALTVANKLLAGETEFA